MTYRRRLLLPEDLRDLTAFPLRRSPFPCGACGACGACGLAPAWCCPAPRYDLFFALQLCLGLRTIAASTARALRTEQHVAKSKKVKAEKEAAWRAFVDALPPTLMSPPASVASKDGVVMASGDAAGVSSSGGPSVEAPLRLDQSGLLGHGALPFLLGPIVQSTSAFPKVHTVWGHLLDNLV